MGDPFYRTLTNRDDCTHTNCAADDPVAESPSKKIRTQEIAVTEDLPVEFQHIVEQLVRDHPGLEKLTITQRKGGWGVWASHAAISKVLQGKQRSPAALVSYIQKWLEQATLVPIFELHPESAEINPSE